MKIFSIGAAILLLMLPVFVSAATLDDYYLSKFGEKGKTVGLVPETAPGEVLQAERCLTPLYRSLKRDWQQLEPATRKVLAKYVSRPVLADQQSYPSPGGHFTIHYALSGVDAPDPTDADSNGVPDWVEKVAAVFEQVYEAEVTSMGYRPPPVTRYDVYLRSLVAQKAYGFTTDVYHPSAPPYPTTSAVSYIEIDKAFTDDMFTVNGQYTPEQLLQITAAHEFHHAIQYGYNYYFDIWFAEVTSTWIEDEIYGSVNQLYSYLSSYVPLASTVSLNASLNGSSEYGRWIFNRYLVERHSGEFIRKIWDRLRGMPAPVGGSDIPMMPVIQAAIAAEGGALSGDFLGFAKKLYLRDWSTHTADISRIPTVETKATYNSYPAAVSGINAVIAGLADYTFAYYTFQLAPSAPTDLTLALANVPAEVQVVALKKGTSGAVQQYLFDRAKGTITVPSFNSATTSEVQLVLSKGSAADVVVKSGDCDASGTVTIAETQSAINMFLGLKPVEACADPDGNGQVGIAEVQKTVNAFFGF